jgi:SnoaL-like domain
LLYSFGLKRKLVMEKQNIRTAIDKHWSASAAGDQAAEHEIYHEDAVCEYPQSGEIIHGRRNLQALRSHHPGKPSGFEIRQIVGEGNLWVTEYMITYEDKRTCTVSIMKFRDGKVSHETQYFADPFEAPAWRAQWVEPFTLSDKSMKPVQQNSAR